MCTSPVWTSEGSAAFWGGTACADGVVYAGADDGRLHAVDAATGRSRRVFRAGGAIKTRP